MSNIPMNNLNIQRRVLNSMHNQSMPMLSNHCFVPLPPNQNQERNPESKINLAFGLLRKNTARTNGIWKIIQSLLDRMKKVEEMAARIDQVIKRNEELEDKRRKSNKKRNEKKRIKREKRQEEKQRKRKENEKEKEIRNEKDKQEDENKSDNLGLKSSKEEGKKKEVEEKFKDSRIPKNDFLEISRTKFDSRNNEIDSRKNINNSMEISRTNLINKKFINKKKIINNKDEISFGGNQLMENSYDDECSLQLSDKINQGNEKLSKNGRNKQNVINLVNRFITNNRNIYNSNQRWISNTFIPLIEDIMDLNLYEIDVTDYVRKIKSPPDFRKRFWEWWQNKDRHKQMSDIMRITRKLKQSKDPDIMKLINCNYIIET